MLKLHRGYYFKRGASSMETANNNLNKFGYVSIYYYRPFVMNETSKIDQSAEFEQFVSLEQAQS